MDLLKNNKVPLSAYDILDKLHDFGFRAPLQVYRALDKLIELGLVHRLETLNAFVACQHKIVKVITKKLQCLLFVKCVEMFMNLLTPD